MSKDVKNIREISFDISDEEKATYQFLLKRWSHAEPYWCVFVCNKDKTLFRGHCCLTRNANLHEILSMLADSELKVEIDSGYFAKE